MSQLVKEAEIEAVQGAGGGGWHAGTSLSPQGGENWRLEEGGQVGVCS